jgi:hypothetical protein
VNPDVSVHSEGDTAVKDGGVKTMWLLQYRTYDTILVLIFLNLKLVRGWPVLRSTNDYRYQQEI